MSKRLYVGNLPFSATKETIRDLFRQYGEVISVDLVSDRMTGRPRGFGFVELPAEAARRAARELNLKEVDGRRLNVYED